MNLSKLYPRDDQFTPRPLVDPQPPDTETEPVLEENAAANDPLLEPPAIASCEDEVQEAFARGILEGVREGQLALDPVLQAFQSAINSLAAMRAAVLAQSHQEMVSLIMAICRKLLHREPPLDTTVIGPALRQALSLALQADAYHVYLHPDDLAEAERLRPGLMDALRGEQQLLLHPDPAISRGGCRVDSVTGEVDATLESQLEVIETALRAHPAATGTEEASSPAGPLSLTAE